MELRRAVLYHLSTMPVRRYCGLNDTSSVVGVGWHGMDHK
jgi:hypothetical protein